MVEVKIGSIIDIYSKEAEPVFGIAGKLRDDYGISFDTGVDSFGRFNWFIDWSFQHSNSLTRDEAISKIKESLDEAGLKYTVRMETYEDVD